MNLLLISNSTNAGEAYLEYPKENIRQFLNTHNVKEVLFVPYAGVTVSWDDYEAKVKMRFEEIGVSVKSIHHEKNPQQAVRDAKAIVVGGGNTFNLLKNVQDNGLIKEVQDKVLSGTPYIGWSAGSNLICPTICTTNDMPIVEPTSFNAFNLLPFQINPHYLDAHPDGHAGETREQRIEEYLAANQNKFVVGLREGCMLKFENDKLDLIGPRAMRIFKYDEKPYEVNAGDDLTFLRK